MENAWVTGVEKMIAGRESAEQRENETQILKVIGGGRLARIYDEAKEVEATRDILDNDNSAVAGENLSEALLEGNFITRFDVEDLMKAMKCSEKEAVLRLGSLLIDAHRGK